MGKEIDLKASFVLDWCSDRFVDVLVRWVSGGLSRQSGGWLVCALFVGSCWSVALGRLRLLGGLFNRFASKARKVLLRSLTNPKKVFSFMKCLKTRRRLMSRQASFLIGELFVC